MKTRTLSDLRLWTPHWDYDKVDPTRCRYSVPDGGMRVTFHQCTRTGNYPVEGKGGEHIRDDDGNVVVYCKSHHPDTLDERRAEEKARWEEQRCLRSKDDERVSAIDAFIGDVDTKTIKSLPPLSKLLEEVK